MTNCETYYFYQQRLDNYKVRHGFTSQCGRKLTREVEEGEDGFLEFVNEGLFEHLRETPVVITARNGPAGNCESKEGLEERRFRLVRNIIEIHNQDLRSECCKPKKLRY